MKNSLVRPKPRTAVTVLIIALLLPVWLEAGTDSAPHTVTSGTNGDAVLTIEADTDNSNENDNPSLLFLQDAGLISGFVGFREEESDASHPNVFRIGAGGATPNFDGIVIKTSNSYVGIGTDTPAYKLDVNGALRSNGFYTSPGVLYVTPQNSTLEGGEITLNPPSASYAAWHVDSYAGQLRLFNGTAYNYFDEDGDVYFGGDVGIGTTTTGYKLAVNGSIRAKEIKVDTSWSDFVFQEDYNLRPLEEVEAHIEAHGHLPDVPSAETIQEEGLSLGESQAILMQKIEELTLYMIDLKKDNAVLSLRVEELEAGLATE